MSHDADPLARIPRTPIVLALLVAGVAVAGTITETQGTQWNRGTSSNITIGNALTLTTVNSVVAGWYRHPWDGATWEEQLSKQDGTYFNAADLCLKDADNTAFRATSVAVHANDYRTGAHVERITGQDYVSTLPRDTPIPLTTGTAFVDHVGFLTSGSHLGPRDYTVRFHYDSLTTPTADVVVPIAIDSDTSARIASTADYEVSGISTMLNHNTSNADCVDDGGDEVLVYNPNPGLDVTDIEFVYIDEADADAGNGWLGGPFALTVATDQTDYDATYQYDGLWSAATTTANAPTAGNHAIFHQMTWSASIPAGSEINIYFTCGDDDNGDHTLQAGELAAVTKFALATLTSPYTLPTPCHGQYVQYDVEIIETFAGSPSLSQVAFVFDDDADADGYGAAGTVTLADCDDADPNANPGQSEVPGNNVDENCDSRVACYTDGDNDGSILGTTFTTALNDTNCTGPNEGLSGDPPDCNDAVGSIHPGATENPGDNIDSNCDTTEICYRDVDGDGERSSTTFTTTAPDITCTGANEGESTDPLDCDDTDLAINHTAAEQKGDEIDQNCDNREDCWPDGDHDGYRATTGVVTSTTDTDCRDTGEARTITELDCNDANPNINGSGTEVVGNGVDEDCDTHDDCYQDLDGDGRGSTVVVTAAGATCVGTHESTFHDDCDDSNPLRSPQITEITGDNVDGDCDDKERCYTDGDNDNARLATTFLTSAGDHNCTQANEGQANDPLDCNDADPAINPMATESPGNNVDEDCSSDVDCFVDADNDGDRTAVVFTTPLNDKNCTGANEGLSGDALDCNDADPAIHHGAPEIVGNSVDDDCDGGETCFVDGDDDGARAGTGTRTSSDPDCADPNEGTLLDQTDCNDGNAAIKPGATELPGDSVDQNCDTREQCYTDADDDGAKTATIITTTAPDTNCTDAREGETTDSNDCNDAVAGIHPGASEGVGDNVDQDCDLHELCFPDVDGDGDRAGTGQVTSSDTDCNDPNEGLATGTVDCDDSTATRASRNSETDPLYIANGVDNNCDAKEVCYRDSDNDDARHATQTVTSNANVNCDETGEAYASQDVDCNDADPTIYPDAIETVGNEVDNNCNSQELCFVDADNDDYRKDNVSTVTSTTDVDCQDSGEDPIRATNPDCDDTRYLTNPGAPDVCGNGIDDNCNGLGDHTGPTFTDDDDDGLTWSQEQTLGTNDCDDDSDNDTIPDDVEVGLSLDPLSTDTDHDGMSDTVEVGGNYASPPNTDGDGLINARDDDDDGDGLKSLLEDVVTVDGNPLNDDSDGDLTPNPLDADDDGDGVPTRNEDVNTDGNYNDNTDAAGQPDWLDTDDDNDGISTINEDLNGGGALNDNTDGDALPNYRDPDDDNDTIPTASENVTGQGDARGDDLPDHDGLDNYLDPDDDNDGIVSQYEYGDSCEAGVASCRNVDADADQNHLDLDSDGDGFTDGDGSPASTEEARVDTDHDGVYDYLDRDTDNDSVRDVDELHVDTDGTGGVNRVDSDDDGDGIPSQREESDPDPNGGTPNYLSTDSDADGYTDAYEWTNLHNGVDENSDGAPNYVDLDSDGDGMDDTHELGTQAAPVDSDTDGIADRLDADDDGDTVLTSVELGTQAHPADKDTDGTPNYLDTDDDNDGENTSTENPTTATPPNGDDTDHDGTDNYLDADDDGDLIPTFLELHVPGTTRDVDSDHTDNHLDTDSDGDGFADSVEAPNGSNPANTDGADTPDFLDFDSDNDLVQDRLEFVGDTDGVAPEDRRDTDDDGDRIPTASECTRACRPTFAANCWLSCDSDPTNDDWDQDSVPDYLDADDDDDFVPTATEDWNLDGDPRNDQSDGDGRPDYMDTDDDDDGLETVDEDVNFDTSPANDDTDHDGRPNYRDDDDDGDTLATAGEVSDLDSDGDAIPNFLDDDDDDDLVLTSCEVFYDNDDAVINHHLVRDSDNDFVEDGEEWFATAWWPNPTGTGDPNDCNNPWDIDQDGIINALDLDDDGDTLPTSSESDADRDCAWPSALLDPDGLPAYFDVDSDNDTIPDSIEGLSDDSDADAIPDYLDCDQSGPDGDSDLDGLTNGDEQTMCSVLGITDCLNEMLINPDHDHDMVVDGVEVGFSVNTPLDTDSDSHFDIEDPDDDGDGILTAVETVTPGSGMPDPALCTTTILPVTTSLGAYHCTDGSGNTLDFDFGDTALDVYWNLDCDDAGGTNPNCSYLVRYPDLDPNFRDADDDGDGKSTADELALPDSDVDGDGTVNWHDPFDGDGETADPDGDGLTNQEEEQIGTDPFSDDTDHDGIDDLTEIGSDPLHPVDSDNDQTIDALDNDDDGDNIPTAEEGGGDADADGTPNHLDSDSDNDGVPDSQEGASDSDDVDCDGVRDAYDADDADGSCEPDSGTKDQLIYTHQGCGGCDAGGVTPTSGLLVFGAALLARRRRKA